MSGFVYLQSEKPSEGNDHCGTWTVGFYKPTGEWVAESDHEYKNQAARHCAWLNGATWSDAP